jgi:VNT family MFS transporter (synaptic vesicle glycoprotein 2)
MLSVFNGVSTASWNALNVIETENYPTALRATAFGFHSAVGRVGAICGSLMFGVLGGASNTMVLPLLCTAVALAFSAIAALTLPETKNMNLA